MSSFNLFAMCLLKPFCWVNLIFWTCLDLAMAQPRHCLAQSIPYHIRIHVLKIFLLIQSFVKSSFCWVISCVLSDTCRSCSVMSFCDLILHDMRWHDMTAHEIIWDNMTWHSLTSHNMIWHEMSVTSFHVIQCHIMSCHFLSRRHINYRLIRPSFKPQRYYLCID